MFHQHQRTKARCDLKHFPEKNRSVKKPKAAPLGWKMLLLSEKTKVKKTSKKPNSFQWI